MSKVTIRPLGGVGQIGSNATLISYKNDVVLIDCGILFPQEDFFDINYLIPDLSKVEEVPSKLIITHGHEDHIGAIHHFIKRFPSIEIWAPLFAKELIERKLGYKDLSKKTNLYHEKSDIHCDDLIIHPVKVNHSIPDTYGILVNTKDDSIFLASDFKVDLAPQFEKSFDFKRLKKLSKNKRRVLLADSTNIKSKTLKTPGESETRKEIESILSSSKGRVFITTFSSNIFRLRNILEVSKELGRTVILHGRSMHNYVESAIKTGHIEDDSMIRKIESTDPNNPKHVILLSGCQGDFKGAFRRVAKGDDVNFKIKESDTFLLSSKAIPGNEKRISLLLNSIYDFGATAITASDSLVHVSGHPGREDLRIVYSEFNPEIAIPIHGESEFISKHCDWLSHEFPKIKSLRLKNFDRVEIGKTIKVISTNEDYEPLLIHGKDLAIERAAISQRRKIACNGLITLSISKNSLSMRSIQLKASYFGLPEEMDSHKEDFEEFVKESLRSRKIKLLDKTAEELRIETRRYFNNLLGYKPITIVHFV